MTFQYFSINYYENLKGDSGDEPTFQNVDNEVDFNNKIQNAGNKLVVIAFLAKWCGACKMILPQLDAFAVKYKSQFDLIKVDIEVLKHLANFQYRVSSMPTFVFFKNGRVLERLVGADAGMLEMGIYTLSKL